MVGGVDLGLDFSIGRLSPRASRSFEAMRKRPRGLRTVTVPPSAWVIETLVPFSSRTSSPAGTMVARQLRVSVHSFSIAKL